LRERGAETADFVDQASRLALAAAEDPAFRALGDFLTRDGPTARAPPLRDAGQEKLVDGGHALEEALPGMVVPLQEGRCVGGSRGAAGTRRRRERLAVDAPPLERVADADLAADDADGPHDAHRFGHDEVAGRCDVVAATGRHVADADDERLLPP